eukprot:gene24111-9686_t
MGNNMSDLHKDAMEENYSQLCYDLQRLSGKIDQQEDKYGWTALHIAATKGCEAIVRELLRRGARTYLQDNTGQTPLHLACREGHVQVVKDLLRNKASAHIFDKSGKTPLDLVPSGAKHQPLRWLVSAAKSSTAAPAPPAANVGSQPGAGRPAEIATQMSAMALNSSLTQSAKLSTSACLPPLHRQTYHPASSWQSDTCRLGAVPPYDIRPPRLLVLPPPGPISCPPRPPVCQWPLGPTMSPPSTTVQQGAFQPAATGQPPPLGPQVPRPPSSGGGWGDLSSPTSPQGPQHMHPAPAAYGAHWQQQLEAVNAFNQQAGQTMQPPPSQHTAAQAQQMAQKELSKKQQQRTCSIVVHEEEPSKPWMFFWKPKTKKSSGGQSADLQAAATQPPAAAPLDSGSDGGWGDDGQSDWGGATEGAAQAANGTPGGSTDSSSPSVQWPSWTDELRACTGGFAESNKLGNGGFGPVYRGDLDGIPVMEEGPDAMQGYQEFAAEVAILSRLHHPHIVLLIGSCPEKGMLVYELMNQGTLDDFLFPKPAARSQGSMVPTPLWWQNRVRIASEVATALLFLHSAPEPIVHIYSGKGESASRLVGTIAYMDPEYLRSGQFSTRSDVYALGMVMLQMLTVDFPAVLDKSAGPWPAAEAAAFADLALKCVQVRRTDRPGVRDVVLPTLVQLRQRTLLYPKPSDQQQAPHMAVGDNRSPEMFCCPITQEVMNDPVFAADGYTYERLAITEWVARSNNSPLTNIPLEHKGMVPNHSLRSAIKEWQEKHRREGAGAGS